MEERKECPFLKRHWYSPWKKRLCLQDKCAMWMKLVGQNPQTGDPVNEYDCVFRWSVITQMETTKETIRTADEVKALRETIAEQSRLANLVREVL